MLKWFSRELPYLDNPRSTATLVKSSYQFAVNILTKAPILHPIHILSFQGLAFSLAGQAFYTGLVSYSLADLGSKYPVTTPTRGGRLAWTATLKLY